MITIEACWGARTTTRLLPGRCSTPRSSSTATAPTGANDTVRSQHRRCKSYCKYRYCRSQMMRGIYVYIYIYIHTPIISYVVYSTANVYTLHQLFRILYTLFKLYIFRRLYALFVYPHRACAVRRQHRQALMILIIICMSSTMIIRCAYYMLYVIISSSIIIIIIIIVFVIINSIISISSIISNVSY